jgi:hypothetical protein
LLLGLGNVLGSAGLIAAGLWVTTPLGLFVVSLINGGASAALLVSGFKNYVRFQHVIWYSILIGFAAALLILFGTSAGVFP